MKIRIAKVKEIHFKDEDGAQHIYKRDVALPYEVDEKHLYHGYIKQEIQAGHIVVLDDDPEAEMEVQDEASGNDAVWASDNKNVKSKKG